MYIFMLPNCDIEWCRSKLRQTGCTSLSPMASSKAFQIKLVVFVGLLLVSKFKGMEENMMSENSYSYTDKTLTFPAPQIKYDVFVSFRGTDIRQGLLSHLIKAFHLKQVFAFVDDKLERGDDISDALFGAIEKSLISLIIFSQDYVSSRWCLEELVKIVECREKDGQTVIPVFYKVDPSDVRYQKGTFANVFAEHEERYDMIKVQNWRTALKNSADLSGFHSTNFRNDAQLVDQIVDFISSRLNDMHQVKSKGLVGIHKPIAQLESLMLKESEGVRVIGIWGLGGIGKTTIAEEVYNRMCAEFESCCFLANVRKESERDGIMSLKKKLFSTLLNEQNLRIDLPKGLPDYVEKRLGRMKVLIVLDDVNDSDQLETLIGARDWFGLGSRIIITTRDKQVLVGEAEEIYQVEALDCDESLELFILNAFKQNQFEMEYCELSRRVVKYAKGIPLVVKVLAQLLRGKRKDIWESQLEKLKRMPNKKVLDIMRLSYDDLDRQEQQIFLDIACFFNGLKLKLEYINVLLKDQDYAVAAGMERLKDKALIIISEHNIVSMHDIIQEMAWEIIKDGSAEYPGNQLRLWDSHDIYQGSEAIRSISFNFSAIKDLQLSQEVFAKMSKLRFLNFYSNISQEAMYSSDGLPSSWNKGLCLPQGLDSLSNEVRYLSWMHYPLDSLPTNFSAENLVILDLSFNRMEKLWCGVKNLANLRILRLYNSLHLTMLPDLSKARNLEILVIRKSFSFLYVHPSVFCLNKLEILDLGGCVSLRQLRSYIHLSSLRSLSLVGCVRLQDFSVTSENLEGLNLELTGIQQLPTSFGRQSKLETLHLGLSDIQSIPETIKNLTRFKYLSIRYCWNLRDLPELPPSLEYLDATGCTSLKTVLFPSSAALQLKENRKSILFWNCLKLDQHSLGAIELNARINLMKFAYQHLSSLTHDYYKDNDNEAIYVYPGSNVPKWLEYRTSHDYVNVDISSSAAPHSPSLGFIFCFIVPRILSDGFAFRFTISIAEVEGNNVKFYLEKPLEKIVSDHVFLVYDHRLTHFLNSRSNVEVQQRLKIKVAAVTQTGKSDYVPVKLKGFGISPIKASEYQNFIQKMELVDKRTKRAGSLTLVGNTSLERFCFQDQKTYFDFIQEINYVDGCWKFKHHQFTNYSYRYFI
ncbi:disease resistance protein RPV1 isoform X2 [Arachis duranensis]|uniref:Disease resistance protein RPV1 isoform X2 n=1 Tax=Arachis duranensis TaxID=130453 RepID=A0A9C6TH28_ARADU|nr:disease resistance protein RPV1 isoform X2 [Arachis duranensis]